MDPQNPTGAPAQDIASVQSKYGQRIKARLAQDKIDLPAARDGMLDCYVATYFSGLKQGIGGYLGINAREEQVAQIAETLFRKRLRQHGATFEQPTVDALDRVKEEVDKELHFAELPAELRGIHDQVCSLMLAKAEGQLAHEGDKSVVGRTPSGAPVSTVSAGAETGAPPPASAAPVKHTPRPVVISRPTPMGPVPASLAPTESVPAVPTVESGLRDAVVACLSEATHAARNGASVEELRQHIGKLERLVEVLAEMG
ncbi:MAG: hypothetical protein AAGF12_38945 [Myxococcota bacterium]